MIRSMTGYGQAHVSRDGASVVAEARSVNQRFLDISTRMPREWLSLEEEIKKAVARYVKRGKVELSIAWEQTSSARSRASVNWELANEYYEAYQQIAERFRLPARPLTAIELMNLPEVTKIEEEKENLEKYQNLILQAVDSACQQLYHMRQSEGQRLREDLIQRIRAIKRHAEEIETRAPSVARDYKERLELRMKEFLADKWEADEGKLLTEVAIFAERASIDEELTRLYSHCEQFLATLNENDSVGRKLDFLAQEMNREINTIGSKANDLTISRKVVELKAELEKIREQVQNIE